MSSSNRFALQSRFLRLLRLLILLLVFIGLGNLAGSEWGPLKKLVHFPAYWAPLAVGLAVIFAVTKRWLWAFTSFVLALGFAAQVAVLWLPPSKSATTKVTESAAPPTTLTVLSFNVFRGNKRHGEVLSALQKEQADVVYLTEMSPEWFSALQLLEKDYPHRITKKNSSDWLLSKHPLENAEILSMTNERAREALEDAPGDVTPLEVWNTNWHNDDLVVGTVLFHGMRIRLAALHPPIPSNASRVVQQRACAAIYAKALNSDPKADAKLLMGDFNTTSFSPTFRSILSRTGLSDTAQGYGYRPTWGPRLPHEPLLPWLGIPIDHILASQNVTTLEHEVGPALGSDHRWVKVRLAIHADRGAEPSPPHHTAVTLDQTSSASPLPREPQSGTRGSHPVSSPAYVAPPHTK